MRNKNGFLLAEETLKIIIALISISFLIYFLTALYFANQGNKDLEKAEASLEFLIEEINAGREQVEIYNPNGWWITSWPVEQKSSKIGRIFFKEGIFIPNSCSNLGWKNCVCICPKSTFSIKAEGFKEDCDDKGICRESDFTVDGNVIKIDKVPFTLNITYEDEITITKR